MPLECNCFASGVVRNEVQNLSGQQLAAVVTEFRGEKRVCD
jgi:hypothetical protein